MALNLTSRLQVTASRFWNRRTDAALSHHGVRLDYDPEHRRTAALIIGVALSAVGCAVALVMSVLKPAGHPGSSKIMADRDTAALYVLVEDHKDDQRLHPVMNLVSAQLIAGSPDRPAFIKADTIASYPSGPMVGIFGAPDALSVRAGGRSVWTVCDSVAAPTLMSSAAAAPTVTGIAGDLDVGPRAAVLPDTAGILGSYGGKTWLLWGGRRAEIDPAIKSVALALGIDSQAPKPVALSRALFDAIPQGDMLVSPMIAAAGSPPPWNLGPGVLVGSVLSVTDVAGGDPAFYVVLTSGVQRISPFVASVIRASASFGDAAPVAVAPDRLASVPIVNVLPVQSYPMTRLSLVDTAVNGTTCLSWSKGSTDTAAAITLLSGQGLPIPVDQDRRLLSMVRPPGTVPPGEADQVYIGRDATNLVVTSGMSATSQRREALWWISDQGVRFGIGVDAGTLKGLGISADVDDDGSLRVRDAGQAPWPLISVYARGPALTRADALTEHDSIVPAVGSQALTPAQGAEPAN